MNKKLTGRALILSGLLFAAPVTMANDIPDQIRHDSHFFSLCGLHRDFDWTLAYPESPVSCQASSSQLRQMVNQGAMLCAAAAGVPGASDPTSIELNQNLNKLQTSLDSQCEGEQPDGVPGSPCTDPCVQAHAGNAEPLMRSMIQAAREEEDSDGGGFPEVPTFTSQTALIQALLNMEADYRNFPRPSTTNASCEDDDMNAQLKSLGGELEHIRVYLQQSVPATPPALAATPGAISAPAAGASMNAPSVPQRAALPPQPAPIAPAAPGLIGPPAPVAHAAPTVPELTGPPTPATPAAPKAPALAVAPAAPKAPALAVAPAAPEAPALAVAPAAPEAPALAVAPAAPKAPELIGPPAPPHPASQPHRQITSTLDFTDRNQPKGFLKETTTQNPYQTNFLVPLGNDTRMGAASLGAVIGDIEPGLDGNPVCHAYFLSDDEMRAVVNAMHDGKLDALDLALAEKQKEAAQDPQKEKRALDFGNRILQGPKNSGAKTTGGGGTSNGTNPSAQGTATSAPASSAQSTTPMVPANSAQGITPSAPANTAPGTGASTQASSGNKSIGLNITDPAVKKLLAQATVQSYAIAPSLSGAGATTPARAGAPEQKTNGAPNTSGAGSDQISPSAAQNDTGAANTIPSVTGPPAASASGTGSGGNQVSTPVKTSGIGDAATPSTSQIPDSVVTRIHQAVTPVNNPSDASAGAAKGPGSAESGTPAAQGAATNGQAAKSPHASAVWQEIPDIDENRQNFVFPLNKGMLLVGYFEDGAIYGVRVPRSTLKTMAARKKLVNDSDAMDDFIEAQGGSEVPLLTQPPTPVPAPAAQKTTP